MKDFFLSVAGFIVLLAFLGFALWFGAVVIMISVVAGVLYFTYLKTRIYLTRWYHGRVFNATEPPEKPRKDSANIVHYDASNKTTIIDVEYEDISGKK